MNRRLLETLYERLYGHFGPQHWWPGETPLEVVVGCILTQNTAWKNVEKAITQLKRRGLLEWSNLVDCSTAELAEAIRPAGYFNVKARRLQFFIHWVGGRFGNFATLYQHRHRIDRKELLEINGIGPETADSILLYALDQPHFVIDAYTKRILERHLIIDDGTRYEEMQQLFSTRLPPNLKFYNEYHALIVAAGKDYCKTKRPLCGQCPLNGFYKHRLVIGAHNG